MAKYSELMTYIISKINFKKGKGMQEEEQEKRRRIIEEATRDGSYEKWVYFGKKLLKKYYWSETYEELNREVVHTLIEKILTGVQMKNWDYENVNINQIMYMNIFGAINEMNKNMRRRVVTMDNYIRNDKKEEQGIDMDDLRHLTLYEVENEINKKEYFKLFEAHLAGDKECLDIFYGVRNNEFPIHDNKEISRKLMIRKSKVENAKRRFYRSIESFQKKGYDRMFNLEGIEIMQ
jgi:hypothetical protein